MNRELMKPAITRRILGYADADKWAKKFGFQMPPADLKLYEAAYEYAAKHRIDMRQICDEMLRQNQRTP